jgi:hypothetical protein
MGLVVLRVKAQVAGKFRLRLLELTSPGKGSDVVETRSRFE